MYLHWVHNLAQCKRTLLQLEIILHACNHIHKGVCCLCFSKSDCAAELLTSKAEAGKILKNFSALNYLYLNSSVMRWAHLPWNKNWHGVPCLSSSRSPCSSSGMTGKMNAFSVSEREGLLAGNQQQGRGPGEGLNP